MTTLPVEIPHEAISEFCVRNHVRKLSLVGSILTDRFSDQSDIDMLVEFEPKLCPGLLGISRMERELSEMVGRKVDLRTAGDLSRYFRDNVVASALPQYESRCLTTLGIDQPVGLTKASGRVQAHAQCEA